MLNILFTTCCATSRGVRRLYLSTDGANAPCTIWGRGYL